MTPWLALSLLIVALLMTLVTCCFLIIMLIAAIQDRRARRYWHDHDRRLAGYHEREAAQNSRPHSDGVVQRATRR